MCHVHSDTNYGRLLGERQGGTEFLDCGYSIKLAGPACCQVMAHTLLLDRTRPIYIQSITFKAPNP